MHLDKIPTFATAGLFHVVVESPRGSSVKLKYPGTRASDGDSIDALIFSDAATSPGVVVTCRALGVLEIDQKKKTGDGRERNDRILAMPESARRFDAMRDVFALPDRIRDEIAAFFIQATAFEDNDVQALGWQAPNRRSPCSGHLGHNW
jgi:inorganic pyrophosphatase